MIAAHADVIPDFVGIGALKAGTTYVDTLLRGHPELSLPRHLKEAEFLTRHWDRGPSWYAAQFAPFDGRLRGELSPQYMTDPRCPGRLKEANPDALVIASVRSPVDRTVSQYRHWVQETRYASDFETFLVEHPNSVERSMYFQVLEPWVAELGREQLHILVFEDLIARPAEQLGQLLGFLGVDDTYRPADPDGQPVNQTFNPRFPRTYAAAQRMGNRLRAGNGARVVDVVKRVGLNRVLMSKSTKSRPNAVVTAASRAALAARVRPDAERLSELLDRDLISLWEL